MEDIEIIDDETPLGNLPKTGESISALTALGILFVAFLATGAAGLMFRKKAEK
jgi:LPXTG-motif cell wall-anchored protein